MTTAASASAASAASAGASAGASAASAGASGTGAPTRVVIAEDEAIIRLDLKEILQTAGYDVVGETARGDEAVALVDQHEPDLVILDVKMPGMDGVRAAREIAARHRAAVVVLTAFSQRDLIEDARDAGVAAYLVKPFRREELLPAVAVVLARCRQDWAIDEEIAREHAGTGPDRAEGSDGGEGPDGGDGPDGPQGTSAADVDVAEDKIATRRIVEEAKAVLIDQYDMSEPDAFAFVQRTAMQTRSRMRDVARRVVEGELRPS